MKNNRKWSVAIGAIVLTLVLASALFTASPVFAHGGDDATPIPDSTGQYPWGSGAAVDDCNHAGWGSGMMGGYGQGWGSGMMGRGYGQGWGSGMMGGYGQGGWGAGMAGGYGR